jgi:drug/metabolite transporter (DMT)-like permease
MPRSLIFLLLLLSLIWGGSFFFIKIMLNEGFGPWTITFLRCSFGLAAIVLVMLGLRIPFKLRKIPWVSVAVMAMLNTAIPWSLIGFSETRLTSSMAAVLNAATPLWTIIVGMVFFKAITHWLQWIGIGVALIGLVVLLDINPQSLISVDLLGFIGMIAVTVCYAFGSQLSKRLLNNNLTVYQITLGTLLCGTLGSGSIAFSAESIPYQQLISPTVIAVLTGLGVFGSGIAYILFFFITQKGSPEFATMVTYLVPASAIIWGSTFLDEPISWSLLAGLAFILAGVFLASKKRSGHLVVRKV